MNRILRKHWLVVAALTLLIIAIVISVALPESVGELDDTLQAIAASAGWALFIVNYFYSKWEKFYIRVNSLRLWLTNEPTKWNFTVDLCDYAQEHPLRSVWEILSQQGKQAVLWHRDDSSLIVNMPGYTLRVFVSDPEIVCIQVSNLELPFRTFRSKIENEAIPLIKDIVDTLQPKTEKYAAKIGFSSTNPYFGFFVRRLDLPRVVSFACDLIESSVGGHDQTVTVRKDRIDIVTDDLLALQALSLKYVRLATK